jgi:hypothetical protein
MYVIAMSAPREGETSTELSTYTFTMLAFITLFFAAFAVARPAGFPPEFEAKLEIQTLFQNANNGQPIPSTCTRESPASSTYNCKLKTEPVGFTGTQAGDLETVLLRLYGKRVNVSSYHVPSTLIKPTVTGDADYWIFSYGCAAGAATCLKVKVQSSER